jgi:dihydroorotate dehydrogenase
MYKLLRPLLFSLPPELAHAAGMLAIRLATPALGTLPGIRLADKKLEREVFGIHFPNPVGLAAGFDKHATAVPAWEKLGFGFAEIGTFTRHPQAGNERPRIWRYPEAQGLINRFGFNNPGADAVALRLKRLKQSGLWPRSPLGINLGKSKATPLEEAAEDYLYSLKRLKPFADYITVNVSSPNTPDLRSLQATRPLRKLVKLLAKDCGALPLLVKFAPDLGQKELLDACDAALQSGASGLILTNTTLGRGGLATGHYPEGGLSGAPLQNKANQALRAVSKHTRGRVPLIGVGGVMKPEDALRKFDLGASLVQIYTGYIYQGPGFPAKICRKLVDNLRS